MTEKHRLCMIIEYDGSSYHGFQRQANANTIQAELETAICRLTGEEVAIYGAGRTDAGVHALGQVIAFDTVSTIPVDRWQVALNTYLPADIRIIQVSLAERDFHPQFQARRKTYIYKIYRSPYARGFYRNHAYCTTRPLDVDAMRRAAAFIVGRHNFQAFCASGSRVKSYEREVYRCSLHEKDSWLTLRIEANGFLYNMVRIVMGTLLMVGQGKMGADEMPLVIASRDRTLAGTTAEPQGLYMLKVEY